MHENLGVKHGPLLTKPDSKYNITKSNGEPIDPEAEYFVMRVDTDINARGCLIQYAACIAEENPQLSSGILEMVHRLNNEKPLRSTRRTS